MRTVIPYTGGRLTPKPEALAALRGYLVHEVEQAFAARASQETLWRELLRQYDAVPKLPVRNTPVENAPNIEVPLAAIASDSIYAQATDLMFQISPIVTCRDAGSGDWVEHAKDVQTFTNWGATNEWRLRESADHSILDCIQLGTGIYYIPRVQQRRKHATEVVTWDAPRVYSVPLEDFLVPGGSIEDLQALRWVSRITYLGERELAFQATHGKWDVAHVAPSKLEWVRTRRETLARTTSNMRIGQIYEIHRLSCYFDIDGDGIDEDLEVVWDRNGQAILSVAFNRYDTWPYEAMRYQLRSHLFHGIGVPEMLQGMQEEASTLHNHRTLNLMLSNARMWAGKRGAVSENMRVWPNKIVLLDNPQTDIKELTLSDVYPSAAQAEMITLSLAERRTGSNELSLPRPSAIMGSRTPATTAMSMLQTANRRFRPAFDAMKDATARSMIQCLTRYREMLLAGVSAAEDHIMAVCGNESGGRVIEALRQGDFSRNVTVELTASSASVNKEADRQASMLLVNILAQYYEKTLQLVSIASNPATPPPVAEVAKKIAAAGSEVIDRTIRTFDVMRDPRTFLIDMEEELDATVGALPQGGLAGLGQLLAGLGQPAATGAGRNGAGPPGTEGGGGAGGAPPE